MKYIYTCSLFKYLTIQAPTAEPISSKDYKEHGNVMCSIYVLCACVNMCIKKKKKIGFCVAKICCAYGIVMK